MIDADPAQNQPSGKDLPSVEASPSLEASPSVEARSSGRPRLVAIALIATALVAAGAWGLYGMGHPGGKRVAHTGVCAQSLDVAQLVDPLARGELAAFSPANAPNDLAAVAFDDADGRKVTVGAFKGRTILLNLWATWCAPCRQEMPSLDRLQTARGSKDFSVIPVDVDTVRFDKAKAFFEEISAKSLPFYADKSADILQALKGKGLPTTVLIGADGCEIGTMAGPAQWDSPDAKTLIDKAESGAGATAARL